MEVCQHAGQRLLGEPDILDWQALALRLLKLIAIEDRMPAIWVDQDVKEQISERQNARLFLL